MHNPNTAQMGSIQSNHKEVINLPGTIEAGLCVHKKSDGSGSIASADGSKVGISVGHGFAGVPRTSVVTRGRGVLIQLTDGFTPVVGAQVHISDTTGKAGTAGAGFTAVNAYYATSRLSAGAKVEPQFGASLGANVGAAYINMDGGL